MATPRPLRHPPITEALIDFRVASDPPVDPTRFRDLAPTLQPQYPIVQERRGMQAQFTLNPEGSSVVPRDLGVDGYFFKSQDERRIAQFRRDGFTLNQLPPYGGAEELIDEALRLWSIFREAAQPTSVTRVAFRYINVLRLPYRPGDQFQRFLTAPPQMPEGAPQDVMSFLTRVVARDGDDAVIVTLKLEPALGEEFVPATLDLDVFRVADFAPDGSQIRATLERLRELKNRVFFASLTDEAVSLFA